MDELFDIVNEDNVVVGQEWRSIVHQRGLWHRGVHIFLFTPDGKLVVQQRSKDRDTFPSALDCSVSEHLKVGEDYHQAAQRGLKEELGVAEIALQPRVEFRMQYGVNDFEFCQVYEGIVAPELIHFDPHEIERVTFQTLPELFALLQDEPAVFSHWFRQLILWYLGEPSALHVLRTFPAKA